MDYTVDPESRHLVIQMQLEETQTMLKGKHRVGEPPDSEFAAQLFKNELKALENFYSDQAMARSIAQAVVFDAELIRESVSDEERVTHDREYAIALENGAPCVMGDRHARENFQDTIDEDMLAKLVALYIGDDQALQTSAHVGSSSHVGREKKQDLADKKRLYGPPVVMTIAEAVWLSCWRWRLAMNLYSLQDAANSPFHLA
ncbi:hypothetical protein PWT90_06754 [Aphanocladium album]|nr:hypothetical protein PWT90_06754 [Aphanocladium album]